MLQLIRGNYNELPAIGTSILGPSIVTIGNFDGVHLGHQQLITRINAIAHSEKCLSVVVLFEPHPQEYFSPDDSPPRLMRLTEKIKALDALGVDVVCCLRFNAALANLSADGFVRDFLVKKLDVHTMIIGDDFRFGAKRQGDEVLLRQYASELDFNVESTTTWKQQNLRVSSTRIRELLEAGDMETAAALLGRPYTLCGRVQHGAKLGRELGFPTANLSVQRQKIPIRGIFVVDVEGINNQIYHGAASIGIRPTVNGTRLLLEVHLLNFHENIYGQHIRVRFYHKIRDEARYETLALLAKQIAEDVRVTREWFRVNSC